MEEKNGSLPDLEAGSLQPFSRKGSGSSRHDRDNKFSLFTVQEETGANQLNINFDNTGDGNHQQGTRGDVMMEDFNLPAGDQDQQQQQQQQQQQLDHRRAGSDSSVNESVDSLHLDDPLVGDIEAAGKGNARTRGRVQFHEKSPSKRGLFGSITSAHKDAMSTSLRQCVQLRQGDMRKAMDEKERRWQRWRKRVNNFLGFDDEVSVADDDGIGGAKVSMHGRLMVQPSRRVLDIRISDLDGSSSEDDEEEAAEKKREEMQYRLTAVKGKKARDLSISGMYEDLAATEGDRCCCCCACHHDFHFDRVISAFLHWAFRSSFVVVYGSAAVAWIVMTTAFAFLIWLVGQVTPHCIGGIDFETSPSPFLDAYQLSWTTFATVGYGLIYPATSDTNSDVGGCVLITILTAFESFVGVVFASLCAALMFAKVGRVQSFAQLTFSDPMVIRYGQAVMTTDGSPDDDDYDDDYTLKKSGDQPKVIMNDLRIPCPVLEFRIFNRMDSIAGGEIMDATLNMTACIDVSQADALLMAQAGRRKKGKKGKKRGPTQKRNNASQRHCTRENSVRTERSQQSESMDSSEGNSENDSYSTRENLQSSKQDRLEPSIAQRTGRDAPLLIGNPAPSLLRRAVTDPRTRYPLQPPQPTPTQSHGQSSAVRTRPLHHSNTSIKDFPSTGKRTSIMDRIRVSRSLGWRSRDKEDSSYNDFFGRNKQHSHHRSSSRNRGTQAFEEDPSGKIFPTKILTKLDVDASDHPFFRRIWLVRHTLDGNSLLLKPHVRDMLRQNNGYWPKELNNYESIRASIGFDQILVGVSGTSNADANSVYAHHVYHMVDVNVGYRFVDALYRDHRDGSLRVDQSLINDVTEQEGGGGEPLQQFDGSIYQEIMML